MMGFSGAQLDVLRDQILRFRQLKETIKKIEDKGLPYNTPKPAVESKPLSTPSATSHLLNTLKPEAALKPVSLPNQVFYQPTIIKPAQNVVGTPQGTISNTAQDTISMECKDLPLFELCASQNNLDALNLNSEIKPVLNFDLGQFLNVEYNHVIEMHIKEREAFLQQLLKSKNTGPGFVEQSLRAQVEKEQTDISNMTEKLYRRFVRSCHSAGNVDMDRNKADLLLDRIKAVKYWRSCQQERSVQERDMRVQRNRHVLRVHEKQLRQHSKLKDDDRTRRMDALRANDLEAYQELLLEQGGAETQGERYEAITKFLNDTEEYLHKLSVKVSNVKVQQEASEAYNKATAEARAMGYTDEEVLAAASQAAKEAAASSELEATMQHEQGDAQSRYYNLAHSVEEVITAQPAMLQGPGNLREYQLIGLQWMVSLFNNRLNGILADEMGLGKTVQIMALLAYLMENKNVYGPHLIIVPNAVIVNWKAEFNQWLPDVRCVYYVGNKDERARKYATEVQSLQFNVLITTYEFIMRDRAKLSKVEWKYIIIDEAQRMKDRQSKLAKDLDRFAASRRLLLTGTPLQNELRELWSLLNLLLPEVFDDKSTFTEWFGNSLSKQGSQEEEWLETEKRVVVIHRLHQILEPFMLRRQVEDVESKLPPKVASVIKVAMTPYQSVIYNWVKETGTIRVDPSLQVQGKIFRPYTSLNNKCMELRKVFPVLLKKIEICNHPALSYPPQYLPRGEDLVMQCGKFEVLDRMLVKLHATNHRVLLFSTMTRLLDLLEHYLRWRTVSPSGEKMQFLRIDGSTSLEERESAIKRFNAPDSEIFIFLLSIRAAGRGLNLQSADTVIIYDPDPNPKNEEQAIARSHRIGQSKEVRVFHLESVADIPDEVSNTGKKKYADSIESLVRNSIQKAKIDMANEVIDAGRFNMETTQEERKETLEALLQDEERMKKATNKVPTLAELNRIMARSPIEIDKFDKLDAQHFWPAPIAAKCAGGAQIPYWLEASESEIHDAKLANSKMRLSTAAEMAATAAQNKPLAGKRRSKFMPGQYTEMDNDSDDNPVSPIEPPADSFIADQVDISFLPDIDDLEDDFNGSITSSPMLDMMSHGLIKGSNLLNSQQDFSQSQFSSTKKMKLTINFDPNAEK